MNENIILEEKIEETVHKGRYFQYKSYNYYDINSGKTFVTSDLTDKNNESFNNSYNETLFGPPQPLKSYRGAVLVTVMNLLLLIMNSTIFFNNANILNFILIIIPLVGVIIPFKFSLNKLINWYIMKKFL